MKKRRVKEHTNRWWKPLAHENLKIDCNKDKQYMGNEKKYSRKEFLNPKIYFEIIFLQNEGVVHLHMYLMYFKVRPEMHFWNLNDIFQIFIGCFSTI